MKDAKILNEMDLNKVSGGSENNITCVCKICGNTFETFSPACANYIIIHGTREGFRLEHRMDYCSKCMKNEMEKQTFLDDIRKVIK